MASLVMGWLLSGVSGLGRGHSLLCVRCQQAGALLLHSQSPGAKGWPRVLHGAPHRDPVQFDLVPALGSQA